MRLRSTTSASATTVAALVLALAPAAPAAAHHGWEHYDTTAPSYAAGTVTRVRWGNPHPEVTLRVERRRVPDGWAARDIPSELEEIGGREVMRATRSYSGPGDELTLVLAPLERLSAWGMEGEVAEGDTLEVVGYPDRDHDGELRPEMIVLENGRKVRQRSVPLPVVPVPSPGAGGATPAGERGSAAPASGGAPSDTTVWLLTGGGVLLLFLGGGYYAVRRAGRA
ncbi:hypothetical protein GTU99_12940 [Streptomyces sp. PRKS01-65]|nr:DUF6152 family protein [Streptomyces harenosi]NEY33085.1 hypothetical protein [Streptomyces harenosi]